MATEIKNVLHLKRVIYGKKDTPQSQREYTVDEFLSSAVGTIKEIVDVAKDKNIKVDALLIEDKISSPEKTQILVLKKKEAMT